MSQNDGEKRVYKDSDPEFYAHLDGMSEAGVSEVVIDGKTYNVAKDKDEHSAYYFILVPIG